MLLVDRILDHLSSKEAEGQRMQHNRHVSEEGSGRNITQTAPTLQVVTIDPPSCQTSITPQQSMQSLLTSEGNGR